MSTCRATVDCRAHANERTDEPRYVRLQVWLCNSDTGRQLLATGRSRIVNGRREAGIILVALLAPWPTLKRSMTLSLSYPDLCIG